MSLIRTFCDNSSKKTTIHVEESNALDKFSSAFANAINKQLQGNPLVIVCIGTDRSTGDCLGPLVGTKLNEQQEHSFEVFGTLDNPVHATNLNDFIMQIKNKFNNPFVIAIDACLGNINNIGIVNICHGSLKPGAGVNKDLPTIGDLHITGIVNVGGFLEYFVLQNTRLNIVMKMANLISKGIYQGYIKYKALNP